MRLWHVLQVAIGLVVLGGAVPVQAQSAGEAPPSIATGWFFIVLALALGGCVCVVSFFSSKRGHQD